MSSTQSPPLSPQRMPTQNIVGPVSVTCLMVALKQWIDGEYEDGRQTTLSTAELETKIEELSAGRFHRL